MTNVTSEKAPTTGAKNKRYVYQEVPIDETRAGTSERELAERWGAEPGKTNEKGRVTRKGSQAPPNPGGPEPAREERGVQPGDSLDQPGEPGDDRLSLDQPAMAGGDRQDNSSLDQSDKSDDDRLDDEDQLGQRLSNEPEPPASPLLDEEEWERVGTRRRRRSGLTEAPEGEN